MMNNTQLLNWITSTLIACRDNVERLSTHVRLLILLVLGVSVGLLLSFEIVFGAILWIVFIIVALLLVNLNTIEYKQSKAVNKGSHRKQLIRFAVFMLGFIAAEVASNYMAILTNGDMISNMTTVLVMCCFVQLLAHYAHSANHRWQAGYSYWGHIFIWLVVFWCSFAFKTVSMLAIFLLITVKFFQLFFIQSWQAKIRKAYAFSLLFPLSLFLVFQIYTYFQTQKVTITANVVMSQVLAYHEVHGEYPPDQYINQNQEKVKSLHYGMNSEGMPLLSYGKPFQAGCRMIFDFDEKKWHEYCLD